MLPENRRIKSNHLYKPQHSTNCIILLVLASKAICLSVSLFVYHNAHGQSSKGELIPLYIPIKSNAFPNLVHDLQRALEAESITEIQVKNTDFWHPYQQGIRKGRLGVYFAQPHFAAWGISKHQFTPLYKLHGKLKYVLATDRANSSIFEITDLHDKTICREAGLTLGSVWLNQLIRRHQLAVNTREITSTRAAMASEQGNTAHSESMDRGHCDAYVIDDYSFEYVNSLTRGKYIRLAQSVIHQQNVFIAAPNVSQGLQVKLKQALKSKAVKRVLAPYFSTLSKWQNLQSVGPQDYGPDESRLLAPYWFDE